MRYITISFCLFCFLSCKKNSGTSEPTVVVPKVKNLRFIWPGWQQSKAQVEFTYDGLGRVSRMMAHYGEFGVPVSYSDSIFLINFDYEGDNKLPYKAVHSNFYGPGSVDRRLHFLTYDAEGRLKRDSSFNSHNPYQVIQLLYYRWTEQYMIGESGAYLDSFAIMSGNYITGHQIRVQQADKFSKASFDNKINPLNSLNIAPIFHLFCEGNPNYPLWSYWNVSNKNNQTAYYESGNGYPQELKASLVYTYDDKQLPTRRLAYQGIIAGEPMDTLTYNYY